eukprot:scaffold4974_cov16-Tisochrysis_lutea.AAC.3
MTLRGLAVSSAPCSNHGSHNSVQGPQGTSQPPAGEVGRVKATLAMMYTCGKCETRSMKTFSHQAYKHGVVLVGYALQHASLLVPIEMLCLHVLHLLGLAQMFSAIGLARRVLPTPENLSAFGFLYFLKKRKKRKKLRTVETLPTINEGSRIIFSFERSE